MKKNKIILPILSASALITPAIVATSCGDGSIWVGRFYQEDSVLASKIKNYGNNKTVKLVIDFKEAQDLEGYKYSAAVIGADVNPEAASNTEIFTEVMSVVVDKKTLVYQENPDNIQPGQYILENQTHTGENIYRISLWAANDITNKSKISIIGKIDTKNLDPSGEGIDYCFECSYEHRS